MWPMLVGTGVEIEKGADSCFLENSSGGSYYFNIKHITNLSRSNLVNKSSQRLWLSTLSLSVTSYIFSVESYGDYHQL